MLWLGRQQGDLKTLTPDERSILQRFLADLSRTPNVTKDPEAEAMIQQAVRSNPNAAYLLVQHAILADQALHAAQAQLAAPNQPPTPLPPPPASPPPPPARPGPAPPPGPAGGPDPAAALVPHPIRLALGRPGRRARPVQPLRRQ